MRDSNSAKNAGAFDSPARHSCTSKKAAMPADVKRLNRRKVMEVLRTGQIITVADVHEQTGISRPTAMRTLQYYCDRGVACSIGLGESTSAGGKKPELFRFADEQRILSINLWPGELSMSAFGLVGGMQEVRRKQLPVHCPFEEAMCLLRETAHGYLQAQGIALDKLFGVALSVSGTVDYDRQLLLYNSQAPEWGVDLPLAECLREIFGEERAYFVDNSARATGRALLIDQPEYAARRVMTLFTTWGVAACMLERGHVLNGRDSLIGEIGHMVISDSAETVCGCGKKGCLESMVSLSRVKRLLTEGGAQSLCEGLTIPGLFELSRQGILPAQEAVRYLAHCFAVALHNLSLAYNQEVVVVQGDFAWADGLFDRCLREELAQFRYYPREPFEIRYDRRELSVMSLRGGAQVLRQDYFDSLD